MRDQVLYGDGTVGTERAGFFPLGGNDGEDGEDALVRSYRRAGYVSVRGVRACGTLEWVEFETDPEIDLPSP